MNQMLKFSPVIRLPEAPKRPLASAGRSELLRLWDLLDAAQREAMLGMARGMAVGPRPQARQPLPRSVDSFTLQKEIAAALAG